MKYEIPQMPECIGATPEDVDECIYVIQLGDDGPIKIGYTRNLRKRLKGFRQSMPVDVKLRAVFLGSRRGEKDLHRRFIDYRLKGEWFLPADDIWLFLSGMFTLDLSWYDKPARTSKGPRMRKTAAANIWHNPKLTAVEALQKMPGWIAKTAAIELGHRGRYKPAMTKERARKMLFARWGNGYRGVVHEWTSSPERAQERERWAQHWRDPKFPSAVAAFEALPKKLRETFGTVGTANKILGPRKPGSNLGRPRRS